MSRFVIIGCGIVDTHGLWGRVQINEEDGDALNLYARVKRGDVSQCSFGFDILEEDCEHRADGSTHYTIKKVKLYEGSVCTFPAYKETSALARSQERKQRAKDWKDKMTRRLRRDGTQTGDA